MDREQMEIFNTMGGMIRPMKDLKKQNKMTFYKVLNGEVIEMPDLPSDPIFMRRYLDRGYTLEKPKVAMLETVEQSQEAIRKVSSKSPRSRRGRKKKIRETEGG
uniref:Uncharacterized protein n=1 Tax=viral metagenome TaxID=1070528 RepID=A0A6M3XP75_9ZZZZ